LNSDNIIEFPRKGDIKTEEVEVVVFNCGHNACYLLSNKSIKCAVCYATVDGATWDLEEEPEEEPEIS
tara:strand:+ start:74 stop:277 length:204 start_codon:yes stop_codon:yes gene_type:complete